MAEEEAIRRVNSSSQVSSVGFNNLKKLNTNSSISTNASTGSQKPNALTRLFTRNRSNTTLDETISDEEEDKDKMTLERKPSHVFRMRNKRKPKKDLTVQTDLFKEPPHRKNTVNSPVTTTFHNLFHRNIAEEDSLVTRPMGNITLSSSNSNSRIQDAHVAKVFKFTDPSNSLDEDNEEVDNYRKLFLPADQFLRSKSPSSPTASLLEDDGDEKFWNNLLSLLKPVILSSRQKKLANNYKASQLIQTQEDIANYVRDNYLNNIKYDDEESHDLKSREITQDLVGFFNKIMILFLKDFKYHGMTEDESKNKWLRISQLWLYFRGKIYYFLLNCFIATTEDELLIRFGIDLETLILNSFKNVILKPFIEKSEFNERDIEFFKSNSRTFKHVMACFGLVNSCQEYENDNEFLTTVIWLTKIDI